MILCIPCRNANPTYRMEDGYAIHVTCGEKLTASPRKWSPPKKNNKRAWKRIENGDWLWDHRRVRRSNINRDIYIKESWVVRPNASKGQPKLYIGCRYPANSEIDLGG